MKASVRILLASALMAGCGGTTQKHQPPPPRTTPPSAALTRSDVTAEAVVNCVVAVHGLPTTPARRASFNGCAHTHIKGLDVQKLKACEPGALRGDPGMADLLTLDRLQDCAADATNEQQPVPMAQTKKSEHPFPASVGRSITQTGSAVGSATNGR